MYQPFKPTVSALAITLLLALTAGCSVPEATTKPAEMTQSSQMKVSNEFWWPENLDLDQLRAHDPSSAPMIKILITPRLLQVSI